MATVKYLDDNGLSTVWSKVKGIVTPKADKVSGATNGHLAGLNSSGNLTDSGLAATNVAQKDGSYSGMTVGAAEDLVSAESVASEFTSRITGGSTAVGKGGTALVDKIKGRTLVWNQQVPNGNFANGDVNWYFVTGGTHTVTNGVLSYSWTSAYSRQGIENLYCVITASHKYYIAGTIKNLANERRHYYIGQAYPGIYADDFFEASERKRISKVVTATTASGSPGNYFAIFGTVNVENSVEATDIVCIDLTLMFGAGNEPATAAEFEALYPLPYYDYHPGKLINNGLQTEYDLVWNQLLANGNFSNDLSGWTSFASTVSASGGEVTLTKTQDSGAGGFLQSTNSGVPSHKYYMSCYTQSDGTDVYLAFHTTSHTMGGNTSVYSNSTTYKRISQITSPANATDILCIRIGTGASPTGVSCKVKNVMLIDLTLIFGAGGEPTVDEFEAMFPADYYPYDTGTEQHFSFPQFKTKIETVGFNIWDEEWENGFYESTNGAKKAQASAWRNKRPVRILPNTTYYASYTLYRWYYDADMNFIQFAGDGHALFTSPANAYYLNFGQTVEPNGPTSSVCISLSDTSRNGTYEPYWRSELELGLGDIKVKSHNLWDEEWSTDGSSRVIPSNNISVSPSTTYYFKISSYTATLDYLDANGATISSAYNVGNSTFTTPANCAFLRFTVAAGYGSTYKNDICINVSDPAFDGRYEPYGDGGVISITGGLKSAGAAYDEISGGKFVKRIESVDLGSLTYTKVSGTTSDYDYFQATFYSAAGININSTIYHGSSVGASSGDNNGIYLTGNTIRCRNLSYTDAATFKAAMSGVPLYYELAQPIEYELADAIPTAMRNDPYGTERRLPEDTAAIVTAPFRADITYSTNIKEAVQSLPQNYININSMQDFLAALGAQMGGTWTMRQADGKFDFTFTPNPVEPTL